MSLFTLLLSLQNTNTKIVHASLSKRYLPYTYLLYACLFVCVFKSNKNIFKCITNKQEDKNDKENLNWKLLIRFADVQLSLWGVGGVGGFSITRIINYTYLTLAIAFVLDTLFTVTSPSVAVVAIPIYQ